MATKDDVTFVRSELTEMLVRYGIVRDCINQTVKQRGETYLPKPSPEDKSSANAERYAAYIERAVFYGVTGRTLNGMVGQVYAREPEIKLPALLEGMRLDATGSGLSLEQLSKDGMREVMGLGRGGIYTDYPTMDVPVTRQQLLDGTIQPTMTIYAAENIVNWRSTRSGSKVVLSLVVLAETVDVEGAFVIEKEKQYRVLRRDPFGYTVQLYKPKAKPAVAPTFGVDAVGGSDYEPGALLRPLDAKGKPLQNIPFSFIGAINNDSTVDDAPLYDLAELNVAHYRNSADYEEACFIVGQPTPWFSGLTEEWVTDVLKGEILLGSRAAVPLPENAMAGLLQVSPNIMPIEAMKHKEAQMVALGARLVENRQVRRTLGEVKEANAAETSILASCANNVSAAFTDALQWAALFVGADESEVKFELNTEFALTTMAADERNALIADMQAGAVSWTEVRIALRRAGVAQLSDEEVKGEIKLWQDEEAKRLAAAKPAPATSQKPPQS